MHWVWTLRIESPLGSGENPPEAASLAETRRDGIDRWFNPESIDKADEGIES